METCNKEYNHFHITHNRFEINVELKIHMQENRQHTHKIVTQDIPWEILIEGKTQPPKAFIAMYYSAKNTIAIQPWKPSKSIATTEQSMWTSMNPHILCHASNLHKMLSWLTCQTLSRSTLSFFPSIFSSHITITLVAAYIVPSPTKPPSGIT